MDRQTRVGMYTNLTKLFIVSFASQDQLLAGYMHQNGFGKVNSLAMWPVIVSMIQIALSAVQDRLQLQGEAKNLQHALQRSCTNCASDGMRSGHVAEDPQGMPNCPCCILRRLMMQ